MQKCLYYQCEALAVVALAEVVKHSQVGDCQVAQVFHTSEWAAFQLRGACKSCKAFDVVELQQTELVLWKGAKQMYLSHAFASLQCVAVSKASWRRARDVAEAEGSSAVAVVLDSWAATELHFENQQYKALKDPMVFPCSHRMQHTTLAPHK